MRDVTKPEFRTCIAKLEYDKASGLKFWPTDLLKICAENKAMICGLEAERSFKRLLVICEMPE